MIRAKVSVFPEAICSLHDRASDSISNHIVIREYPRGSRGNVNDEAGNADLWELIVQADANTITSRKRIVTKHGVAKMP